jgi:acyl-coenzyme A thioesterase 13
MSDDVRRKVEERIHGNMNQGFQRHCGFRALSWGGGKATVELAVTPELQNPNGSLHGGAVASLIDYAGTVAIMSADRDGRPGVTTDLNTTYLAATPGGDTAIAEATVLKVGRTLAFVTCDVRRKSDGALVAQGRMTKFQA